MGLFLNPDIDVFSMSVASDIYVDKTRLIDFVNRFIGKERPYLASSRPRRFGKTMAAKMLAAYYSKGCNSKELFNGLKISKLASFEKHLNKFDVILMDLRWMYGIALEQKNEDQDIRIISFIQSLVINELRDTFPSVVEEHDVSLPAVLAKINNRTGKKFVVIIDEWDCIFREDKNNIELQKEYIDFLRGMFKGIVADKFIALAYITGILPIKKYGTQSALNNFREFTMLDPLGMAEYVGFTEEEVVHLCDEHKMSFSDMKHWYDGYSFDEIGHIYCPNSVIEALNNRKIKNYWTKTETYELLMSYIAMNFDGLKQKIVDMLAGGRCKIDSDTFQNDMTSFKSADDIITLLIHLGYLAYDIEKEQAYIPNNEVRSEMINAVSGDDWDEVYKAITDSEKLLKATWAMEEDKVAKMIHDVHTVNSSSLVYNNEISLSSIIMLAYYSAAKDYTVIRELPAGDGFADMVFIPKRSANVPAMIVELKWDKSAEGEIGQIKDKGYVDALKEYKGNLLLVGINYDKKTRVHQCKIEKYEMK